MGSSIVSGIGAGFIRSTVTMPKLILLPSALLACIKNDPESIVGRFLNSYVPFSSAITLVINCGFCDDINTEALGIGLLATLVTEPVILNSVSALNFTGLTAANTSFQS